MDVNTVLLRLMKEFGSLPAIKLAWSCQLHLQDPTDIPKISPSHYLRELQYTSEERQALLAEQHRVMKFSSNGFKISVEPSILAFQNYKRGEKYSATLTVQNIDKTMQKITFRMSENGPFLIDENSRRVGKFASGLLTTVVINFKPEDEEDYYHKLIVVVNNGGTRIPIPVIGFGGRGLLDFPDKVNFGQVPVNHYNKRLLPVLNIGTKTARFIVSTKAPFDVSPEKGIVLPNDSISLTLSFNSKTLGRSTSFLRVKYDTGEEVYVQLEGEAISADITFNPMDIEFQDTFIGMVGQGRVTIRNNSEIKAKFQWRGHDTSSSFLQTKNRESISSQHKLHLDGSGDHQAHDHHHRLYSREDSLGINKIINSQNNHGGREEPLYADESFRIEPPMGEIQPHSCMELIIFFSPLTSGMFLSEAFCDIEGLETRTVMRLIGRGLGAKFKFGFDVLDVGGVCLGGGHSYEIPVTNLSQVEGTIGFDGFIGLMGDQFQVKPNRITLSPGEFSAFFLFYNPLGKPESVYEELRFKVRGTNELISITIKGDTAFPTVRFAEKEMNFGEVSYGFPETRQVVLISESLIPLDISMAVEPDGTEQVLTAQDIIAALQEPDYAFPTVPQEFQVEPSRFILSPRGFQRLTVTMTGALYGVYAKKLSARIGESTTTLQEIPIAASCVVPTLLKSEARTEMQCVAGFPCPGSFTIHNPSALSAVYCCVPTPSNNLLLTSDELVGIVRARKSITIHFMVTAKSKGDPEAIIEFFVAGQAEALLDLVVVCHTISPVGALKLDRKQIDMGERKVHITGTDMFKIINSSSIPIPYMISLVKGGGLKEVWKTNPAVGVASPDFADNPVEVSVLLNDLGTYVGVFSIRIPGTREKLDLQVTVTGIGCSLIFTPELNESGLVDFGYIFTHTPTIMSFQLTNPGVLAKHLEWKPENEEPPVNPSLIDQKNKKTELVTSKPKKPPKPKQKDAAFEIVPRKKVLKADESFTLDIKANSTVARKSEMGFTLWAYADLPQEHDADIQRRLSKATVGRRHFSFPAKLGKKASVDLHAQDQVYLPTAVQTIKVAAEFAIPKLKFSNSEIFFRIDSNPTDYTTIYQQTKSISLENPCDSSLAVILHTASPFGLIIDDTIVEEWKHTFEPKEHLHITLIFDTSRLSKDPGTMHFSGTLDCVYELHPASDESIQLTGELHFATVSLERDEIDFGQITNGEEAVETFIATNPGMYCVSYKLYIVADSVSMRIMQEEADPIQKLDLIFTSSDVDMFQQESRQIEKHETLSEAPAATPCSGSTESLLEINESLEKERRECEGYKAKMSFFYDKFYRMKLMSFLGLRDPDTEFNDELTYFHYFQEKPAVAQNGVIVTPNEMIDIIPANGLIQAGSSLKFTLVFYAQSNIHFEAKVCISVENGVSKFIQVKGQSVSPPDPYEFLTKEFQTNLTC